MEGKFKPNSLKKHIIFLSILQFFGNGLFFSKTPGTADSASILLNLVIFFAWFCLVLCLMKACFRSYVYV